jgi:hypothetical protein
MINNAEIMIFAPRDEIRGPLCRPERNGMAAPNRDPFRFPQIKAVRRAVLPMETFRLGNTPPGKCKNIPLAFSVEIG